MNKKRFRNIFIVQNRNWWNDCPYSYDKELDLVLTFDFGLLQLIQKQGGTASYLDHMADPDLMERYNHETYNFFETWYLNQQQKDIFSYKGLDFGNTLRLDFWNDVTYYVRIVINLMVVRKLAYERLFSGVEDDVVLSVLGRLGIQHDRWPSISARTRQEFYFPAARWMKENIRPQCFRQRLGSLVYRCIDFAISLGELLRILRPAKTDVYVDRYHPTLDLVECLKHDKRVNVVLGSYTRGKEVYRERRLRVGKVSKKHTSLASGMLTCFKEQRATSWEIEGFPISDDLYSIIEAKIVLVLPQCFNIIETVNDYFKTRDLRLFILTANIGLVNGILLDYCHRQEIPVYFIINGMMIHRFKPEQISQMTWINSYGESIKKHYFQDAANVICCGDPRMDHYINNSIPKQPNYDQPTIVIGAGGFSNIDLNSYTAAEFDFLDDIMQALRLLANRGRRMNILLKVRSNGYIKQYRAFLREFYSELPVEVFDTIPFNELILRADFYMSIYSGTLFEASLLGIPVIYYKKDNCVLNPPYDGKSELVTAFSVEDLVGKLDLFYEQDYIFETFKNKKVMEKYIGPLDGHSLKRNMDFIYSILFEQDEVIDGSASVL